MNFKDIVGQNKVVTSLINSIETDRIGHAYVFVGPRGIGKRTVARIFAAILLCENLQGNVSCMECQSCKLFFSKTNPDFIELEPEEASIKIDIVRNMLSHISIKPMYSERKVYLIPDADRMTIQAQNALLKTLEEPPDYAVLILTTSNFDALIETIHSRTLRYNFKRNTNAEVHEFLKSKFPEDFQEIDFIASYSDGIIGVALELASSGGLITLRDKVLDNILKLSKARLIDVFEMFNMFNENKTEINTIFDIMILLYRDMLIMKNMADTRLLINSDKKDIILNIALQYSVQGLVNSIEIIEESRNSMRQNMNFQLVIETMLMRLQEECD